MFGCSFTLAGTNNKYFCKGTCSGKDILVKTNGSKNVTQDRYSIEDNRDGVFYVTIKNLMKTDSGTYWCGVERYGLDSYQEVHLTVTDAPPTSTTSPVTSRRHVSTSLLNLSTTLPNLSTTSSNLSTTLPNLSNIPKHLLNPPKPHQWSPIKSWSDGVDQCWSGSHGDSVRSGPAPVLQTEERNQGNTTSSSNTQPDPAGEVVCVYEEIRDRQTDTLPVVISSVYSTVKSPTNSTIYPTDQPASLIYSSVDLPTDSRVSSCPPTASGNQDDSIYSTAQLPKDTVESTRYPAVHSKDTPEDAPTLQPSYPQ
ncbi:uncharacterized protein LOC127931956 [Oncorhynchus keta]|uniref:uncharacterized protein LOC127931956 n=1 Tax=Oncorhynchus keta TaxID=8018 RepID=UPI00227A3ADC|nr:uncharacterized protein LOC127931956 [Oncorhynchus keta]